MEHIHHAISDKYCHKKRCPQTDQVQEHKVNMVSPAGLPYSIHVPSRQSFLRLIFYNSFIIHPTFPICQPSFMTETCTILQILHFYAHFCKDSGISFLIRNLHKWLKSQHSPLAFLCFSADSSVSVQSRPAVFFLVPVIVLPISIGFCVIPWCIWFLFHYNSFLSRSIAFSYTKTAFQTLDTNFFFSYNKKERISSFACQTRACTGFDGGFEVREAICGPGPHSKPDLKIKRKR